MTRIRLDIRHETPGGYIREIGRDGGGYGREVWAAGGEAVVAAVGEVVC